MKYSHKEITFLTQHGKDQLLQPLFKEKEPTPVNATCATPRIQHHSILAGQILLGPHRTPVDGTLPDADRRPHVGERNADLYRTIE